MLQFYLLSIVVNALAGYILFSNDEKSSLEFRSSFTSEMALNNETFRLVLGILAAVTGLMKILSPIEGDIPVLGDLLIAITGFFSGFILIYEYYRNRSALEASNTSEGFGNALVSNKKIIGIAAIVTAVLHFIFPRVLLL